MYSKSNLKYFMSAFAVFGLLAFGIGGVKLESPGMLGGGSYHVYAEFDDVAGLEPGDPVTVAGIKVGRIKSLKLVDYVAVVEMSMDEGFEIQEDAVASIRYKGLLGDKYVQITPGGSDRLVKPGGAIRETEPCLDPEGLISKYICGKVL
jgi:phospholipid/cholesterol/gamma-HCH transport system substrate-binding protein